MGRDLRGGDGAMLLRRGSGMGFVISMEALLSEGAEGEGGGWMDGWRRGGGDVRWERSRPFSRRSPGGICLSLLVLAARVLCFLGSGQRGGRLLCRRGPCPGLRLDRLWCPCSGEVVLVSGWSGRVRSWWRM